MSSINLREKKRHRGVLIARTEDKREFFILSDIHFNPLISFKTFISDITYMHFTLRIDANLK